MVITHHSLQQRQQAEYSKVDKAQVSGKAIEQDRPGALAPARLISGTWLAFQDIVSLQRSFH